jgi:hypothetical protein
VFLAGEAAVKAERSEFILSMEGRVAHRAIDALNGVSLRVGDNALVDAPGAIAEVNPVYLTYPSQSALNESKARFSATWTGKSNGNRELLHPARLISRDPVSVIPFQAQG